MDKKCKCGSLLENIKRSKCDDCRKGRRGLKWSEMLKIAELQGNKCPLLGTPFEIKEDKIMWTVLPGSKYKKKPTSVMIDHNHKTGLIRGLLSDMGNQLLGGFERGEYGQMTNEMPNTMKKYIERNYAYDIVGEREFQK